MADSTRALRRREVEDVLSGDIRTLTALVPDRPPRRWRVERAYTRLCERLQREGYQPDLIHLHVAADAAMPAVHWAERWGLPLVISENWTAYHSEHGRAFRGKDERAVRRALQGASMHLPVSGAFGPGHGAVCARCPAAGRAQRCGLGIAPRCPLVREGRTAP